MRALTFALQDGWYGSLVEGDVKGCFDHIDQTGLVDMVRVRIEDRAFLRLLRKGLKAGSLETDGRVIHPETGTPPGGTVSPVRAKVDVHDALDRWVAKVVKAHGRGEARRCRYADDGVCAFRDQDDAERLYRVLPKRREQCNLQGAPEKTHLLRCSRFHPSRRRRCTLLGCEVFWRPERHGVPRVTRRTARKKLQAACRRIAEGSKRHRHRPGREVFQRLNARVRGHDHDDGVGGNSRSLHRCFHWVVDWTFTWLNRRGGKRRSFPWEQCTQVLDRVKRARPHITEVRRRRVYA